VAVVAAEEPLTAAKKVQARTLTWRRRPGMESIHGERPRKRFSEILLRKRISPIQMKKGRAIMAEPLVLFQATLARMEPKDTSLKKKNPPIPTRKREMPIQIEPPRRTMRRPRMTAER